MILWLFLIVIVLLVILIKSYESSNIRGIYNIKTGEKLASFTITRFVYDSLQTSFDDFPQNIRDKLNHSKEKGSIFGGYLGARFSVYIDDPETIREVLSMKNYTRPPAEKLPTYLFRRFFANSLLFVNGEKWVGQRRLMNNAFKISKIKEMIPIFERKAEILIEKFKKDKNTLFDFNDLIRKATFDIIGEAGFGYEFEYLEDKKKEKIELTNLKMLLENVAKPLSVIFKNYEKLPFPSNKKIMQACNEIENFLLKMIKNRRQKISENKEVKDSRNLLDFMLFSEEQEKCFLSDEEIINNCMLFFFAGHDTTTSVLSSMFYFLAKYPSVFKKAKNEINEILKDEKISSENISKLVFCNAVLKETLRLRPPVAALGARVATKDLIVNDFFIPKNTLITCNTSNSHFNEKYWENPFEFVPERFLDEKSKISQKEAFFPFGYGPRKCIGQKFAILEIMVFMVKFLKNFEGLNLKENYKWKSKGNQFICHPLEGLPLQFF